MANSINTSTNKSGRFGLMCRKMIIEQRRRLLMIVLSYLAFCAVPGLWAGYFGVVADAGGFAVYIFFVGIACAFAASNAFAELKTKEGRIALLTTPSRTAEKFWPRVIMVTVGAALLVALGQIVIVYTNMLMIGLKYKVWLSTLFNPFSNPDDNTLLITLYVGAIYLANQSLFIFGAVAWPRRSFIISMGVFIVIMIVSAFAINGLIILFEGLGIPHNEYTFRTVIYAISAFLLAVAAALLWGAYYKLKNKQIG